MSGHQMQKFKECLSFDDVLLTPQMSNITSRKEIDLTSKLGPHRFAMPIISSPMDTVTAEAMTISCLSAGAMGVLHRYNTISEQVVMVHNIRDHFEMLSSDKANAIAAAIGVSGDLTERATKLFHAGSKIFCVDVAHGHHTLVERALKTLRDKFGDSVTIIAGNVATPESYIDLSAWGASAVRVGIGGGSICSTRIETGHGVPTFQSVFDCATADADAAIIADGGIKKTGDIVKALAAGADFAMLGSMLAGTDESPGDCKTIAGQVVKTYRGMASVEAQEAWRGSARSLEGISATVPHKGPVKEVLKKIDQNIRSGLSYSGAKNLKELRHRAKFIKQTPASQVESNTHILLK